MLFRNMILTVFCSLLLAGCSSGGGNPVAPLAGNNLPDLNYESLSVGVSDYDANGNPIAGYGALGIFSVHVDKDSLTGEITPLRSTASTDVLEVVDITNFLMMAPCSDCAKLMSVEIDADNNLVLKIGIRHPFPAGDPLKPVSGQNRGDLHVFNIEGLIVSDGTGLMVHPGMGVTIGNVGLVNADGYSAYLDGVLDEIYPTDATVHPYILHFDDYTAGNYDASNPMGFYSVTNPPPSGNLVMAMGCDYDVQDYAFNMDGNLDFIYAVGCTYAVSADSKHQRFTPEYRVPQHLKKASSEVWVEITNNELADGDENTSAELAVYVVDINHGVAVGEGLNEMAADSSVSDISVEIPQVTASPVSFGSTPSSGTGHDPSDPLVFTGTVYNSAQAVEGSYSGLVKVTDSYPPGSNTSPLLNGMDGIQRVGPVENPLIGLFGISEFATYSTFTIEVILSNQLPICDISYLCGVGDPPSVNIDGRLLLDGSGSTDPDGTIESYEWDLDYDGVTFDIDVTGATAGFLGISAGTFDVALRVTDNSLESSMCTTQVVCSGNPRAFDTPVRVTNTANSWLDMLQSPNGNAVVVTKDCVVHLMYFTWWTNYPYQRNILYTYYDGTSWSAPEHIHNFGSSPSMSVAIELDREDNIHATYCIGNQIWYSENSSGSFIESTIESGVSNYRDVSIAVNSSDQIMIAVNQGSRNMTYYNDGTGFGLAEEAMTYCTQRTPTSGVAVNPDICASPDGNFHMVSTALRSPPCPASDWSREVFYAEFDGTSWTDYGPISNIASDCHQPRVISDSDGNLHCVLGSYSRLLYGVKDASSGVWSSFDYIVSGYSNYEPDIQIDQWGRIHTVWYRRLASNNYTCMYKTFEAGDSVTDIRAMPEVEIPACLGGGRRFAHNHVDFNGDMHVVYEDCTLGYWTNREIAYVKYH